MKVVVAVAEAGAFQPRRSGCTSCSRPFPGRSSHSSENSAFRCSTAPLTESPCPPPAKRSSPRPEMPRTRRSWSRKQSAAGHRRRRTSRSSGTAPGRLTVGTMQVVWAGLHHNLTGLRSEHPGLVAHLCARPRCRTSGRPCGTDPSTWRSWHWHQLVRHTERGATGQAGDAAVCLGRYCNPVGTATRGLWVPSLRINTDDSTWLLLSL